MIQSEKIAHKIGKCMHQWYRYVCMNAPEIYKFPNYYHDSFHFHIDIVSFIDDEYLQLRAIPKTTSTNNTFESIFPSFDVNRLMFSKCFAIRRNFTAYRTGLRPLHMHIIHVRSNRVTAFEPFFANITLQWFANFMLPLNMILKLISIIKSHITLHLLKIRCPTCRLRVFVYTCPQCSHIEFCNIPCVFLKCLFKSTTNFKSGQCVHWIRRWAFVLCDINASNVSNSSRHIRILHVNNVAAFDRPRTVLHFLRKKK